MHVFPETGDIESAADASGESGKPGLALVIPALNESATVRDIVFRALRQVQWIIVVDDGSIDGTAEALKGLPVVVLRNGRTLGKAASLRRGMRCALRKNASAILTLDADGQHAPEDIPRLIAAHRQHGGAIVIGARLHDSGSIPRPRYLANRFANFWIGWAAGYRLEDSQSGFRLYPAAALDAANITENRSRGFVFESEILIDAARAGVSTVSIPIPAVYGTDARPSHFRPIRDIALITRMVAWKLLSRGMHLPGLIRSLQRPPRELRGYENAEVTESAERS